MPRLGWLEKILAIFLVLSALAWALGSSYAELFRAGALISGLLLAVKLLHRLFRMGASRLLWRVRNRMIVLFLFIGLVPLVLVTVLVVLAGYVLTGQVAVQMANSELDRRAGRLQGVANSLVWSLRASGGSGSGEMAARYLERAAENWPGLQAFTRVGGRDISFPPDEDLDAPRPVLRGFRGIVRREGKFYFLTYASDARATENREPQVTAPQKASGAGATIEVMLLQPLSEVYLGSLTPGLGRISIRSAAPGSPAASEPRTALPEPRYRFDYPVLWATVPFRVEGWQDEDTGAGDVRLQIETRPSAVFLRLFGQRAELAEGITVIFAVVGTLFLIVELLSLLTGISITRTLTSSIHDLYEGTQKVNKGNFSHRIRVSGKDQLAELAVSFNSMTASIERLVEESKERQRLASELEIAREVQQQFFPKFPPVMRTLEIVGVCNAARTVSGDYFDFVKLADDRLALAIGDVAGKGISAALLMASMQSMLHTQLSAATADAAGEVWKYPTAQLVSKLNVQLYESTAPEKYATFFFGAYDDRNARLTYTNAGHLPPVLIRNGVPERLSVNGLVVGAFHSAVYEQSEIDLQAGDLFVAFTDGVTEPENEFAEEFGEQRLIELLLRHWRRSPREVIDEVIGAVTQWTGSPELQDDMTLVVARRL